MNMEVEIRLLPSSFSIGHVAWELIDKEEKKWCIYSRYDRILDQEDYIVFKFKKTCKSKEGSVRQYRPAPPYETDNTWYCECNDENDCYDWLKENELIKNL